MQNKANCIKTFTMGQVTVSHFVVPVDDSTNNFWDSVDRWYPGRML